MNQMILALAAVLTLLAVGAPGITLPRHGGTVTPTDATPPGPVLHPMDANPPTGL